MSAKKMGAAIVCTAAAVLAAYFTQERENAPMPTGNPAQTAHQIAQTVQSTTAPKTVSRAGVALTIDHEGCRLNAYKCPADVWTNGVGNTHGVDKNKVLTIEEVAEDLRRNIGQAEACINKDFNGRLMNQNQFDAMASLAFNLGCGGIKTYYSPKAKKRLPTTIYKAAQARDFKKMCARITDFNRAGGRVVQGLKARREREQALCNTP